MTMLRPLDPQAGAAVAQVLQYARTRCVSPALALNQAGLLVTDDLANHIRADILVSAAKATHNTRVKHLIDARLIPKEPTPAVVIKAIAQQLEKLAEAAKRGEFR